MKKLFLLLLFIPFLAQAQKKPDLTTGNLRITGSLKISPYPAFLDSAEIKLKKDSLTFTTKKNAFSFDKPVYSQGHLLGGGSGSTDTIKTIILPSNQEYQIMTREAGLFGLNDSEGSSFIYSTNQHNGIGMNSDNITINSTQIINLESPSIHASGNVSFSGLLTYKFCHAVGSSDSINYTPIVTQNLYTKINTGVFAVHDTLGIIIRGDSLKVQYAGDYKIHCWLSATTSNANDKLRIRLYTNNSPNATSLGRWIINSAGTGNGQSQNFMWYKKSMAANTWISIRITNLTASRNPNITDFKVYIEKVPE